MLLRIGAVVAGSFTVMLSFGLRGAITPEAVDLVTPTVKVDTANLPFFEDDLDFAGLDLAIERQLQRYSTKSLKGTVRLGGVDYPQQKAVTSLVEFKKEVASYKTCLGKKPDMGKKIRCQRNFNTQIAKRFDVFKPNLTSNDPRYGDKEPAFFTGYYTPVLEGQTWPDAKFKHAVYARPKNPKMLTKTREQIDFVGELKNQGLELFYTPDLFPVYLLHVEGGGKVLLRTPQGFRSYYLSYSGTNRRKWRFISRYMINQGMISNGSVAAQRKFLAANPHLEREIYSTNPSYIYFSFTDHPPLGSDLVPLTDRRSLATDNQYYGFKGLLTFVKSRRPAESSNGYDLGIEDPSLIQFNEFSRFYLDQDTGGAIKGKARADLYFGEGPYAEFGSANMSQTGEIYFLMLKN